MRHVAQWDTGSKIVFCGSESDIETAKKCFAEHAVELSGGESRDRVVIQGWLDKAPLRRLSTLIVLCEGNRV
jgi:hypothetical protein